MPVSPLTSTLRPWRVASLLQGLAPVGLLVLLAFKYTWHLELAQDVALFDETVALADGMHLATRPLPGADWGPLYLGWYFLLSRLAPGGALALFYLNYKLLLALLLPAIYVVLRALGVGVFWALAAAGWMLASNVPLASPWVSFFSLLLELSFFALAIRQRRRLDFLAMLGLGALLASLTRPELFLSFALFAILFLIEAARRVRRKTPALSWRLVRPACCALAAAGLLGGFGLPMLDALREPAAIESRSLIAFGQHFALRQVERRHLALDPWNNWRTALHESFGPARSPAQCLRANPAAFFGHLGVNLLGLPKALFKLFLLKARPELFFQYPRLLLALELLAAAGLGLLAGWRLRAPAVRRALREDRAFVRLVLAAAVFSLPPLLSCILIYPRFHYVILWGLWLALLGATVLARLFPLPDRLLAAPRALIPWGLLLLALGPNRLAGWNPQRLLAGPTAAERARPDQISYHAIAALQGLSLPAGTVLLEAEGGLGVYLPGTVQTLAPSAKDRPFNRFLRERAVGLILLSPRLLESPAFQGDPEFKAFLNDPARQDFVVQPVPGTPYRLALRRALAQP